MAANRISERLVKAFARFNADLEAFGKETSEEFVTLYEDAYTTREVNGFRLCKNGKLTWRERDSFDGKTSQESEMLLDDDEARDYLLFWRANLRRARKYWSMSAEVLDRIQDGEMEDISEED